MKRLPTTLLTAFVFIFFALDQQMVDAVKTTHDPAAADIKYRHQFATIADLQNAKEGLNTDFTEYSFSGSPTKVFTWSTEKSGFFAVSLDGERLVKLGLAASRIKLRYAEFDPLSSIPDVPDALASFYVPEQAAYIVQFKFQSLAEMRGQLRSAGAEIHSYLPDNSYIVQMDRAAVDRIAAMPFVRWIGRYQPAYKLDPELIEGISKKGAIGSDRYNIMLLQRGYEAQERMAGHIAAEGGTVHALTPQGFRMEATLTPEQLIAISRDEDVLFIDRWSSPEVDMSIVRSSGGADLLESVGPYTGQGVRGEVMDSGLRQTHTDFQSGLVPLIHNSTDTNETPLHGSSVYGIIFGRGTSDPTARGLLPDAQGIFADFHFLGDRYVHTQQLLSSPWNAVFQSNSWGSAVTTSYTTDSAELDDIAFLNDIVILNSQSNTGNQDSRPEAWSKNVVSVGGIVHMDTPGFTDDRWANGASIGPAADGRLKPDLAHFYDSVNTTEGSSDTAYTNFSGTSAATPITAGHFGLFFQMWHAGLFGNSTGATVFDSRPKASTAKAIMINTAEQWDMTLPGTDTTRDRQGWGRANVDDLYALRNKMRIIDETKVLEQLQTATYFVSVPAGSTDPLKITMVYSDPKGTVPSTVARINDVTLKVTAPDLTEYWGNVGLGVGGGMWSASGGSANTVDTVENVFIQSPPAGEWKIEVIASEINEDARPETPLVDDVDFALVASGVTPLAPTAARVLVAGRVASANGVGVRGVLVTLTDAEGFARQTYTSSFGHFAFREVPGGATYIVSVNSRKQHFDPASTVITTDDDISDIEFRSIE